MFSDISTDEVRRQLALLGFSNVDDATLLKYVQQLNEQHAGHPVEDQLLEPETVNEPISIPYEQSPDESNAYDFFFGAEQSAATFINDSMCTQYESDGSIPETTEDLRQGIADLMHSPIQSVNSPKYSHRIRKRRQIRSSRIRTAKPVPRRSTKAIARRPATAGKCKRKKLYQQNSSLALPQCRKPKQRTLGFKSSDPVSLHRQFNRSWKRDKFLNKKTTRQSQSFHTLSSISLTKR